MPAREQHHVKDQVQEERTGSSRWTRFGSYCAAGLGTTLVVCTVVVAIGRDDDPRPAASGPVPAVSVSGVPALVETDSSAPAPVDVSWQQVGLGVLPFSRSAGPARVDRDGVPSGFKRDRQGAVLAAVQILGRLSWAASDAGSMRAVALRCTTPAADALAAVGYGPPTDPSLIPALAGFQVLTLTGDAAVVNLALRFHATLRIAPVSLVWVAGDWRLSGAPGPLTQTSWAAVEDLTGYVLFAGAAGAAEGGD